MPMFKHERTECQCVDEEANRRIFWLDPGNPGRVYVYLSPDDAAGCGVAQIDFYRRDNLERAFRLIDTGLEVGDKLGGREGRHLLHREIIHHYARL